ncbi:MAG: cytochrome d ubiquinol oxidase subunit II [Bacteroidales bacterium]|nr:cytochrome d ubiquinol oxidase subunit II [Bacteroidales bacterium]
MFETLSHLALQQYWWVIISLLGAILAFLMFVQGGQTLLYQIGKTEDQRTMMVNSLGKKWELTFTTLVTFGGAFFASFPLFYSTSFGGAYWVWMLILFGFIIQAVSYEYRKKQSNVFGAKTFETFLFINGLLATVLIGAAISTFFTGSAFSVNDFNQSRWEEPGYGLEAALNIQNLSFGLAVFFLTRVTGSLFFLLTINEETVIKNSVKQIKINAVPFVIFFLLFVGLLLSSEGYAVNPDTKLVSLEAGKYLNNFLEMPLVLAFFLIGVLMVLFGIFVAAYKGKTKAFWIVSPGVILVVFSLFLIAGFNNTSFYPSSFDLQSSLTIENSSSSHYTLTAMSYVSLFIPFVIAYIWVVWKALTKKKIDKQELDEGELKY